jgi:hypothetical protein
MLPFEEGGGGIALLLSVGPPSFRSFSLCTLFEHTEMKFDVQIHHKNI